MIREGAGNVFWPGTNFPNPIKRLVMGDALDEWLGSRLWDDGTGVLLTGTIDVANMLAMNLAKGLLDDGVDVAYWSIPDFLADTKRLWMFEDMVRNLTRDEGAWNDYLAWERAFWDVKDAEVLILTDIHMLYTPMHLHEFEALLRHRKTEGNATVVAMATGTADDFPAPLKDAVTGVGISVNA